MSRYVERIMGLLGVLAVLLGGCAIVTPGPVACFETTPLVLYAGEKVMFDGSASYSKSSIVSYTWEFGDGETTSGQTAAHTFAEPGRYQVTLRVADVIGRTGQVSEEIVVYLRTGSEVFFEDFSSGSQSLARWDLDPTWASTQESKVENLGGGHGFVLYIESGIDRWHRRTVRVSAPPLRVGQQLVFSCQAMTTHSQDAHTFFIFPARKALDTLAGSLPYYVYTSKGKGSYLREPDPYGGDLGHPLPFKPKVYSWHTYRFVFSSQAYQFAVDEVLYASGKIEETFEAGGEWLILLGDESHVEACNVYFDDIRMWIEER